MTMRGRASVIVAAVSALLVVVSPSPTAGRAQPRGVADVRCPGVELAPSLSKDPDRNPDGSEVRISPDSRGKFVPVIMIHGWTGRSTHTEKRDGAFSHRIDLSTNQVGSVNADRSLVGQLQRNPGAAVFTFDYHDYSARWVDDSHIGPALGDAIDCLFRATGEKVIVVAHSMGGLATRYALSTKGKAGVDRATEVSTVITFGTPNTGSVAAMLGAAAADVSAVTNSQLAVLRLVLAGCGRMSTSSLQTGTVCDWLPEQVRAFDSEAGRALRYGSRQLAALKPFPKTITVNALAGDTTFEVPKLGWFTMPWDTYKVPAGDMIVTTGSATHGASTETKAKCSYQLNAVRGATDTAALYLKLAAQNDVARQPLGAFSGACFHGSLMRTIQLTNEATGAVNEDIQSRRPITDSELLNSTLPARVCDGGNWRSRYPIQLHNGKGEARTPSGAFDGTAIYEAKVIGSADFNGDGRRDSLISATCIGGPIAQCCAGRSSHSTIALPLAASADKKLSVIGFPITAGKTSPCDQYGPAQRDIREMSIDGTAVITTEYIYYPENCVPPANDPAVKWRVRHELKNGNWVVTKTDTIGAR